MVTPRGGAASVTPAANAAAQDEEKKAIDPKIFLVLGLLLVAGVIGGFTSGIFGGGGGTTDLPTTLPEGPSGGGGSSSIRPPTQSVSPPQGPSQGPTVTDSGGGPNPPLAAHFKTVVPPDPRYSNGTMAILPTSPNISPAQASGLAKYAKQMFAPGGRWTAMQVVVFSDPAAAKAFQKYQAQRRNAKLTAQNYQELASQGLWNSVPAYYETQGKSEQSFQPSANPNNWWNGRGR